MDRESIAAQALRLGATEVFQKGQPLQQLIGRIDQLGFSLRGDYKVP